MTCRFGHAHPPFAVRQPQNPFSGAEGKVHCFKCHFADGKRTIHQHWYLYSFESMIQSALEDQLLCTYCFAKPSSVSPR